MSSLNNRLWAAPLVALLGPLIEQRTGVKLTEPQLLDLVAAAPMIYHAVASTATTIGQKCAAAFMMYFPPKNPLKPVEPAGIVK